MSEELDTNMDISCDVCCDLIPLVRDGVASADSEALVQEHIARCEACRALMEKEQIAQPEANGPNDAIVLRRLHRSLTIRAILAVMLGLTVAMVFRDSVFRVWWVPLAGAACYLMLRRYWLLGVLGVSAAGLALVLYRDVCLYGSSQMWILYSALSSVGFNLCCMLLGVLVAALLRYALEGLSWKKLFPVGKAQPEDELHAQEEKGDKNGKQI